MAGKIFVIADLHLSFGTDKPMDIFGKAWENHAARLAENWRASVDDDDIVIVAGDLSWGLKEHEAVPDLEFIDGLSGRKILMKGNHELWWTSLTRLRQIAKDKNMRSLHFLHNNAFYIKDYDIIVCGTRGWKCPECESGFDANELKVYKRELLRMNLSLTYGRKLRETYMEALRDGKEIPPESAGVLEMGVCDLSYEELCEREPKIIMCFHFPPFATRGESSEVLEILAAEGIHECYFGHLHGMGRARAGKPFATADNVKCYLTSADFLELCPMRIDFEEKCGKISAMGEDC